MAKKITRGITGIKDINKQDFDTNNVNDLLSDGQYNYIHRKKGKSEEYHNLTDNIKTISSDNTDLLTVTNNNKTNNTATLSPKHDAQKEQVLESERNTITIQHGTNATTEKTKVDTNPQKVLEHNNLLTDYGIKKTTTGNTTKLGIEYTKVEDNFDLNNLSNGLIRGTNFINSPLKNTFFFVKAFCDGDNVVQEATKLFSLTNVKYIRSKAGGVGTPWSEWREQLSDRSAIYDLLAQKQNKLTNNDSIGVVGNGLRQLYIPSQTYTNTSGVLKTRANSIASSTNANIGEQEFTFILKINQGSQEVTFTLNNYDKTKFNNIITTYGVDNAVRINGCLFELSDTTLTVTTDANTGNNYVITFSDII